MSRFIDLKIPQLVTLSILVIALDQITKKVASLNLQSAICNSGIAFGISLGNNFFIFLILLLVLYLIIFEHKRGSAIGLILIFAGGLSNLVGRIFTGCVVDFISILKFPTFNLADATISFGVIIIIYNLIFAEGEIHET